MGRVGSDCMRFDHGSLASRMRRRSRDSVGWESPDDGTNEQRPPHLPRTAMWPRVPLLRTPAVGHSTVSVSPTPPSGPNEYSVVSINNNNNDNNNDTVIMMMIIVLWTAPSRDKNVPNFPLRQEERGTKRSRRKKTGRAAGVQTLAEPRRSQNAPLQKKTGLFMCYVLPNPEPALKTNPRKSGLWHFLLPP